MAMHGLGCWLPCGREPIACGHVFLERPLATQDAMAVLNEMICLFLYLLLRCREERPIL